MEPQHHEGCLVCGKSGGLNRGLCSTHHSRYYREVREMTAEQKAVYDQMLIDKGLLLPIQKRGPKVYDNPFATVAQELYAAEAKAGYEIGDSSKRADKTSKTPKRKKAARKKQA